MVEICKHLFSMILWVSSKSTTEKKGILPRYILLGCWVNRIFQAKKNFLSLQTTRMHVPARWKFLRLLNLDWRNGVTSASAWKIYELHTHIPTYYVRCSIRRKILCGEIVWKKDANVNVFVDVDAVIISLYILKFETVLKMYGNVLCIWNVPLRSWMYM